MMGFISFSKTGKHYKEFDEIFIDNQNKKFNKRINQQRSLEDFDKMSKCKTTTKHLYIRIAKNNSNRKLVKMVKKENKKPKADEQPETSIINADDAWISVTEKAVYINISLKDVNAIPVSEWENDDGEKKERITLVGSKVLLQKVINGEKKGVPLAYFKE